MDKETFDDLLNDCMKVIREFANKTNLTELMNR